MTGEAGLDDAFRRGEWKVVGIFDAGGSSFESEIWADVHNVQDDTRRGAVYACARMKMVLGTDVDALIRCIADDPRINLQAQTEADYYKDQSVVANHLRALGMIVAVIMGIGAVFAAMLLHRRAALGVYRARRRIRPAPPRGNLNLPHPPIAPSQASLLRSWRR